MVSRLDDSALLELTGKIMVIAIIVIFLVVLFLFFVHLYAKWFWYRREDDDSIPINRRRRRRIELSPSEEEVSPVINGLDPSVLKSIPVVIFSSKEFKEGLECPVCLSEIADGEKTRMLPKCNHGFHVECIDMWFHSHSTCPLCRNPLSISNQSSTNSTNNESSLEAILDNEQGVENSSVNGHSNPTETPNFPTNVLFWGNESQVSTLGGCLEEEDYHHHHHHSIASQNPSSSSSSSSNGDGAMVIDIPRHIIEEEDTKSPLSTRMRSFKRLLSRDRRVNPSSPSNFDLEQASRSQI